MKNSYLFSFFLTLILFRCVPSVAQNKTTDSLSAFIKTAKEDTTKVNALNKLSVEFDNSGEYPKALFNANAAYELAKTLNYKKGLANALDNIGNAYGDQGNSEEAIKHFKASLKINEELKNKKGIAYTYNVMGIVLSTRGDYEEALKNYFEALRINVALDNKKGIQKNYNNIGFVYFNQGNYTEALKNYFQSLEIAEKLKDEKEKANVYLNIGNSYWEEGNYTEALTNQLASLKINEALGTKNDIALNYMDIGLIHYRQEEYPEAMKSLKSSLKIYQELGVNYGIANSYDNLGLVYFEQRDYKKALANQIASLKIFNEIGDKKWMAFNYNNIGMIYFKQGNYSDALKNQFISLKINTQLGNKEEIAAVYNNIGIVYIKQKKHKEAADALDKGLNLAKEIGNKERIKENYLALAELDSAKGNWKDAYNHHKLFLLYKDSLINEKNTKKLVQDQMQFNFNKEQDAQKLEQATKDAITAEEKQRQKIIILAVSLGLFLVIVFSFLLANRFRLTLKQKRVIELQKKMVEHQKELVEEKNKQVTDSITYAKRIQTAILPSPRIVQDYLTNSFVLYIPKDIVAGDFYWMEKVGDLVLFAACDCTGHGVSGAMVSVVCNNALNRAVREFGLTEPASILNKVTEIVIESFAKSESEIMDGMDASLCAYNSKTKTLQWAGAYNPLWIVKQTDKEQLTVNNEANFQLIETKGDKQPIGGKYQVTRPFTNHAFELNRGDTIYLFSDGFADQFGGETGRKKLTRKRFKELILSIQSFTIEEQKKELENFFYNYKKEQDQVDDILVMAVRV